MGFCTCLFILLYLRLTGAAEFKLSDSKLLLPYFSSAAVNYTITGSGGPCFEWWSGSPEVVTAVPLGADKTCSRQASVTAVWQSALRRTSTIYARDYATGHVLKCDVIVDDIHHIKVDTTTQELYLHNTPESLVVVGYDEFGNTFSSLDGLPFEWKIHQGRIGDLSKGSSGVLRFLTWTESEYTTPNRIGLLEADGMQGYMQLVSGLKTGSAIVSAALREPIYKHVSSAKVRLLVMANTQLNPPVLYLMPNSIAYFQVSVVRQDAEEIVTMPSYQYYLSVSEDEIAGLDTETGAAITAHKYGQTTVILFDRNVEEAIALLESSPFDANDTEAQMLAHHRRPVSIVHVVEPAYFRFIVQPLDEDGLLCSSAARRSSVAQPSGQMHYNHWALEVGKKYLLMLEIYDQNNHRLYPADNIRIYVMFPEDSIAVFNSTQNGTIHLIAPLKTGPVVVKAALESVLTKAGETQFLSQSITGSQEIIVYSPLKVLPSLVNIAWDISANASSGYALAATGGSGDYSWTVLNTLNLTHTEFQHGNQSVVTISNDGVITPKGFGSVFVVASDLRNPDMCSYSSIRVSQLSLLRLSPGRVELYLPKRPLSIDGRLSSARTARLISLDANDLIPALAQDQHPQSQQEKMANSILAVGITASDTDGKMLVDCHDLPIEVRPSDPSVVQVLPGLLYLPPTINQTGRNICAYAHVVGLSEGFTELEASYFPGDNSEDRKVSMRLTIAVYKDIEFFIDRQTVAVAVKSSILLSFVHGPNPWRLDSSLHFVNLNITNSTPAVRPSIRQQPQSFALNDNSSLTGHYFVLRCESFGVFEVNVIVGNRPSSTNVLPGVLRGSVTLVCESQFKIQLTPHLNLPTLSPKFPPCPFANRSFSNSNDIVPLSNNAPLKVEIIFQSVAGHTLVAVDSIDIQVLLSSAAGEINNIVSEQRPKIHRYQQFSDTKPNFINLGNPFFYITPRTPGVSSGQVRVQLVADHRVKKEPSTPVESSLTLSMSPNVLIEPIDNILILNHPKATTSVHLARGSGFFYFNVSSYDSHSAPFVGTCLSVSPGHNTEPNGWQTQRDFLLRPLCKGKVIVRATDLCFPAEPPNLGSGGDDVMQLKSEPATDQRIISIVGLGSLRLSAPSQLQLLSSRPVYVRAFDTDGDALSARFASLLPLHLISTTTAESQSSGAITHRAANCPDAPRDSDGLGLPQYGVVGAEFWLTATAHDLLGIPGIARFYVCGQILGSFKLKVISGDVASNSEVINVFEPLSLEPCNVNLLLGAAYQLFSSGGPSSRSISFRVKPNTDSGKPPPKLSFIPVSEGDAGSTVLLRSSLGPTGVAMISVKATSVTGYTNLDTRDFSVWGLVPPLANLSSEALCQVNVVALSGVRIGCPLPPARNSGMTGRVLIASANGNSSLGGVPVWVEGVVATDSGGLTVTPMGMADIQPPLHFFWRLSPPMPNAPAELVHWLSHLRVDPDDTSLSSGMVLIGVSPGQVRLQLTVSTEEGVATGQLLSMDMDKRGSVHMVKQLSAEIVFTIVSHLSLLNPPRENPHILISPNSQLQLRLASDIMTDGEGISYSVRCPTVDSPPELLQVSSTGLLRSAARGRCNAWSNWRLDDCMCHLRVDYRAIFSGEPLGSDRTLQSLAVDVVVKPPVYLLARAQQLEHCCLTKTTSGLPFGGPYPILLSFHDEHGECFDAVGDELLSFQIKFHRSNLLDYSITNSGSGSHPPLSRLMLRLTPPLHTDPVMLQSSTTLQLAYVPASVDDAAVISPTYLTIPTGPLLEIFGIPELNVGQWVCLPSLAQGDGVWSSSDPSILLIDNASQFMLPLRTGRVHIQFTPKSQELERIALMGKLIVTHVCLSTGLRLNSDIPGASILPVGLSSAREVHFRVGATPEGSSFHRSCTGTVPIALLSELSPFSCTTRLEPVDTEVQAQSVYLPNWLRAFLLAERYVSSSTALIDSDLLIAITGIVPRSSDFTAQLIPSSSEWGVWKCIVRSNAYEDYYRLATLPIGSRLIVEVGGSCGTLGNDSSTEVIARSELKLAPAFTVLLPPLHLNPSDMVILTPWATTGSLLVFVPAATLAEMDTPPITRLKARSQRPELVEIDGTPRPVQSVVELKSALKAYLNGRSTTVGGHIEILLSNISRMIENEVQVSPEHVLGLNLVWIINLKSMTTKTATDAVVEVVLSLKITNQHVSVPIRVRTHKLQDGETYGHTSDGESTAWRLHFLPSVSWHHLLLLVFITCILLAAAHVVTRTLNGGTFGEVGVVKHLPPLPNSVPSLNTPRLWSHGYGQPCSFTSPTPLRSNRSPQFSTPFGDVAGGFEGEMLTAPRFRIGSSPSSPSRLREAFDTSL